MDLYGFIMIRVKGCPIVIYRYLWLIHHFLISHNFMTNWYLMGIKEVIQSYSKDFHKRKPDECIAWASSSPKEEACLNQTLPGMTNRKWWHQSTIRNSLCDTLLLIGIVAFPHAPTALVTHSDTKCGNIMQTCSSQSVDVQPKIYLLDLKISEDLTGSKTRFKWLVDMGCPGSGTKKCCGRWSIKVVFRLLQPSDWQVMFPYLFSFFPMSVTIMFPSKESSVRGTVAAQMDQHNMSRCPIYPLGPYWGDHNLRWRRSEVIVFQPNARIMHLLDLSYLHFHWRNPDYFRF
jgi:hypothetical protein